MKSRVNENKLYLNGLIQKGNLNQAINEMLSQKRKTIKEKISYLELLHYSNRLAKLNNDYNLGIMTKNNYDIEYNKISYAIIKIINQRNIKYPSTLNNWRYGIIILIIGGLILPVIVFFYNSNSKALELRNKEISSTSFSSFEKEEDKFKNKKYLSIEAPFAEVISSILFLREKPTQKSRYIARLALGDKLRVLENTNIIEKINGNTGIWIKVSYKNNIGFVFSQYIRPSN